MGWFLSYNAAAFGSRWGVRPTEWMKPQQWVNMGVSLERAGWDYMMLEDASFIPDVHGGSMQQALASGTAPKHDPMALVPLIGAATSRLGIIATMTSTFYPPYLGARLMATLDHLTEGRVGLNMVTSHNLRTAQNFGMDGQIEHDERYRRADEWIRCVKALWDTWEPGAIVMDEVTGVFADHTKVHEANFQGEYYSSRGPLNTMPGPQGRPVICQAGGSPAGRAFAAEHADTVVASVGSVEAMKSYREDMDERLVAAGRKPTDCKVLFVVSPILADSQEMADELAEIQLGTVEQRRERALAALSFASGVDFTTFDLDAPVPEIHTNAARSTMQRLLGGDTGATAATLRELVEAPPQAIRVIGTPDAAAAQMGEYMQEAGGDGFLISGTVTPRFVAEIAEGLGGALRRRGLIRDGYSHEHLRDNLLAF
ncbi:NtaA/DmoA family FMN-dependent monooxygenase [Pseudonocardia sp. NPDC049635]|uniref:NtaA/DmoA family FMN-dependent monooxygenase n=1 Tax=Pseudonocardia sp. NPDC049635 TaxID=3155506 RepID=UPI0033EAF539